MFISMTFTFMCPQTQLRHIKDIEIYISSVTCMPTSSTTLCYLIWSEYIEEIHCSPDMLITSLFFLNRQISLLCRVVAEHHYTVHSSLHSWALYHSYSKRYISDLVLQDWETVNSPECLSFLGWDTRSCLCYHLGLSILILLLWPAAIVWWLVLVPSIYFFFYSCGAPHL